MIEYRIRLTSSQIHALERMKDMGPTGLAAVGGLRRSCRVLVRRGMAAVKPGMEATYVITARGKDWLEGK